MKLRELIELYVNVNAEVGMKETALNNAFQELDEENWLFNIIPKEYRRLVDVLLLEIITEAQLDWIGWWMYEEARGVSDDTGVVDLENFDEFYDFVFLNKTVAYIVEQRNEQTVE